MTFDIWHLIFDMTEGTDSISTDTYDIGASLSVTDSLTHSLNNIGLRDASAYKYYSAFF